MKLRTLLFLVLILLTQLASAAISLVDDEGQTIVLASPARRIISLSPHVTELLFAAGGGQYIVGAISYSDFPEAAKKIPVIGDNRALDIERILALKPDLVIVWRDLISAKQIVQLRHLGIPMFFTAANKLQDIPASLQSFGKLMATETQANLAAQELRAQINALTSRYAHRTPVRLFYQVWDKPLYTLNGQHIVSDAIRTCGGVNIFANLNIIAPNVSIEAVLEQDPQAIIATAEKNPSDGGVTMWTRYPSMTAVRQHNLFLVDGNLLNRPGPRMITGVAELCAKLDGARTH